MKNKKLSGFKYFWYDKSTREYYYKKIVNGKMTATDFDIKKATLRGKIDKKLFLSVLDDFVFAKQIENGKYLQVSQLEFKDIKLLPKIELEELKNYHSNLDYYNGLSKYNIFLSFVVFFNGICFILKEDLPRYEKNTQKWKIVGIIDELKSLKIK